MAMVATEQRWCGVVKAKKRGTVIRDILIKEHRRRKNHWMCCRDRINQGIGSKSSLVDRFSRLANFGCENSGQCNKRLQQSQNAHGRVPLL